MRKFALSLALLAAASLSTAALAADSTASGKIKALDAKACTVTLDNSTVYHFDAKCDLSKFKVGEMVGGPGAVKDGAFVPAELRVMNMAGRGQGRRRATANAGSSAASPESNAPAGTN